MFSGPMLDAPYPSALGVMKQPQFAGYRSAGFWRAVYVRERFGPRRPAHSVLAISGYGGVQAHRLSQAVQASNHRGPPIEAPPQGALVRRGYGASAASFPNSSGGIART